MILGAQGWPIAMAKGMQAGQKGFLKISLGVLLCQFEITTKGAQEASDDTIVMGNLGYFQVAAGGRCAAICTALEASCKSHSGHLCTKEQEKCVFRFPKQQAMRIA